ncbi:MAG: porin [Snodgrassella sp.]|uniref:porin n=1 Tax=Snodgrassella sp. TaxID=2815304 RepID=UPI00258853BA|nr:porin [Snodgrassella sp.]MCO6522771.1 porin [Snodgrassella sp.]
MKKTLIALALTTLPVAAMAEVVLYGQMKAGYEVNSSKVTGQDRDPYLNGIADYGSRIGFKGSEDLGNGLKAIWQVESRIHLGHSNGGSDGWANRDSFIGLQHDKLGTLRAGRISNAINANMDVVDAWEYGDGSDALGLGKFTRTDARYVGIAYDSPEWAGFNFNVLYSPRDNVNGGDRKGEYNRGIGSGDKYSLGLNYKNSGFYAKYGFDYLKNSAIKYGEDKFGNETEDYKDGQVHRVEGGYDANNLFVGVGYQYTKNTSSYVRGNLLVKSVGDHNVVMDNQGQEAALTVGYHFGNVFPKISYAHGWDVKIDGTKEKNTKYDQIVLGADYDFSKRTTANVQAGWLREGLGEDEGKIKTTAFGVGLKHTF